MGACPSHVCTLGVCDRAADQLPCSLGLAGWGPGGRLPWRLPRPLRLRACTCATSVVVMCAMGACQGALYTMRDRWGEASKQDLKPTGVLQPEVCAFPLYPWVPWAA